MKQEVYMNNLKIFKKKIVKEKGIRYLSLSFAQFRMPLKKTAYLIDYKCIPQKILHNSQSFFLNFRINARRKNDNALNEIQNWNIFLVIISSNSSDSILTLLKRLLGV